jgi:hypothetical protein
MAVGLGREARIGVAEDPLDRRNVGTAHEQQRRCRVAQMVEADRTHLSPTARAAARSALTARESRPRQRDLVDQVDPTPLIGELGPGQSRSWERGA